MRFGSSRGFGLGIGMGALELFSLRPASATPADAALSLTPAAAIAPQQPIQPAARPSWVVRFERERPFVLRAIEGLPPPAGYELENRYDSRRLWSSGLGFAGGFALQLLAVLPEGIQPVELVPCAGPFLSEDTGTLAPLIHYTLGVPACVLFLAGSIELGRGLADVRPVWVRSARALASRSVQVGGYTTGRDWRLGVATRF